MPIRAVVFNIGAVLVIVPEVGKQAYAATQRDDGHLKRRENGKDHERDLERPDAASARLQRMVSALPS